MSEQLKFTQVPSEYDVKFNPGDYYSRQLYSAGSVLRKNRLKKDKLSVRTDRIGKRRISKFAADRTMNRRRKSVEDRDFDSDSDGGGEDDREDEDDRYSEEEEEEALEEEEEEEGGICSPVDIFTRNALKIIVLSEKDIITVQEYLEKQRERKEELMKKVWHHLKGSEKQSMKLFGFHRWQENTDLLRDNEAHKSAIILQALARMYLARNVLDVKTEEWFQRQEDKRKALHAQFRYSTPDYKWAVTMDKKIYFETVTDLNRYAQFLRLTMYKVGKYLVRKRTLLLAMAMKKWRQGMATFLESDIASSHVNDVAIDFSSTNPADQYGNLVAQRDQITFNHLLLQEKAAEVADLTLPKEYVDEMGYETVVSLPWRLPVVPDIGEAPIRTHASNEQNESGLLIENGESTNEKDSKNAVQEGVADNSERPRIGSRNGGSSRSRQSSRGEGRGGGGMEGASTNNNISSSNNNSRPGSRASNASRCGGGGDGGGRTMSRESSRGHLSRQSSSRRRRRRSSSRGATPNITTGKFTPERSRPASRNTDRSTTPADTSSRKRGVANGQQQQQGGGEDTFEEWEDDSEYEYYYSDDDEFYDGEEGFEEQLSPEELQRRAEEEAAAAAAVEAEWKASMHSLVPSYFPAEGMQLPPLPQMFIPHTAEERLHLKNERRLNYCAFREHMMGPTFDSNWVLPSILCMGCMPWGPADTSNLEYPEFEPAVKPSMFSLKSTRTQETSTTTTTTTTPSGEGIIIKEEEGEGEKEMDPVERSRKQLQAVKVWKPPTVTAVSTLLLNGIDCFVSLMEPEEEEAVEVACRVPPMEEVIQTSLKQSSSAVATIISQCTENIRRKQKQLDDIPVYGKTDPRFKMVYREQLRCKARIQLEQDKMAKARSQVRNLAPHVFFERIAMSRDGESITANEVFPKLWHLEHLLKEGRKIYLYSRDGHGRAGMVAAMLVGRLYHLNTHEALYRVQAMHDSAKREAGRKIPINCPQLPAQRDLVTEVLNLTNRIQHPTYVRTQIDPETFFERFPTNPYYYQGAVDASKQRKKDTNAQRDQNQNLEQETGSVGSLGSRQDSSKSIQLVEKQKPIRKWKSLQTQEETALEAAEDRLARELGDNAQVLKKEKQFLDQLYAPENQRRKQTITLSVDGDYVFEGSDIVYRGPATSTAAASGGGGVERDGIPAAGHASLLSPTTKQRLGSSKHGATASAKINHSIRRVERGGGGGGGSHTSAKKSSTTGGVDAATATAAANDADMSNAADGDAEEDAAGTASHSTGRSRKADSSASSGSRRSAFRGSRKENKAPLAVETQDNPQIPAQERRNRGGGITVRSQEGILNDSSVTTTTAGTTGTTGTTGTPLPITTTTTTTTTAANRSSSSSSSSSFAQEGEADLEQDEGREAMIDPRLRAEPKLPELYDRSVFGQSVDVARKLPVRRPSPAAFPLLPLLRHTNARTPQPKLVPTRHNTPATGLNHTGANIMRQQQQRRGMSSSSSSSSSSAAAAAVTATTATAAAATSSCSSSSSNGKDFISLPVNNHTMSSSSGMMEGGATTTTNTGTLYLKNSSS